MGDLRMSENERSTSRNTEGRRGDRGAEAAPQAEPSESTQPSRSKQATEAASKPTGNSAEPVTDGGESEVQRLQSELDAARRRIDDLARAFQGLQQDREEFKQRLTRERERMIDVERGNVAVALIEAIDELDRCLQASNDDKSPLAQGVRFIRESILRKLKATGVERLEVVGQQFDPKVAEAADTEITTVPEDDQRVVAEVHAGYRLKDKIIRPARVKVSKYIKPAQA